MIAPSPAGWPGRYPARMADWTPAHRSRAAREGWRTRRWQRTPEAEQGARLWQLLSHGDPRTLRLLACDVAAGALGHYTARYPDDHRPHAAIEAARRYAQGRAGDAERLAAARILGLLCDDLEGHDHEPAGAAVQAAAFTTWKPAGRGLYWAAWWAAHAAGGALDRPALLDRLEAALRQRTAR